MEVQGIALSKALREDGRYQRPYILDFDTTKSPDFEYMLKSASEHSRGKCKIL